MSDLWRQCQSALRAALSEQQFHTWISPLQAVEQDGTLTLAAPNRFVRDWVRDKFIDQVRSAVAASSDRPIQVEFTVADPATATDAPGAPPTATKPRDPERRADAPPRSAPSTTATATPRSPSRPVDARGRLNPHYTFDTFVAGKANQLARAAGLKVADHPGRDYNPLFIYGGTSLGKTHLIHAIGNQILAQNPDAAVRYIHAEQYVSDVVRAHLQKSFDPFRKLYHSLDLLLIDDIQFMGQGNKDRTQEEFFYAFNALIEARKQVIITCDTFPREIAGVEDRLRSRFGWGLTLAIEPPELELRVAILLKKAAAEGIALGEDVAFFIATHIQSNVRELEGALKRVAAYANFADVPIDAGSARDALRDVLAVQTRQLSIENIQRTVADLYKIRIADMESQRRTRVVARPRQMAMALAKELTTLSLPEIGKAFGGRDHTTVLHACRKILELRDTDAEIRRDWDMLLQTLRG
jgi:chromosomal replication initiator protein